MDTCCSREIGIRSSYMREDTQCIRITLLMRIRDLDVGTVETCISVLECLYHCFGSPVLKLEHKP